MYFFAIALFFLLLEFLVGSKRVGKRMFMILILLGMTFGSAYAQTDRKEVRKGNRYFKKGEYKEAEVEYRKALIKDSLSVAGNYNLANTLMQDEDAANAELIYAKVGDTISKMPVNVDWERGQVEVKKNDVAPDYYHNLGNSYLAQKKYQEAVDAYKNALRRNPGDSQTRENYIYAKKKLEGQQNQDQQQNQQNQDQQQNQDNQQNQQNQDHQQNQDQNNDNKQNDQNNDQKQDQKDQPQQQNGGSEPKITPQAAQQMLQAIQEKENQTQEKVKEEKAKLLKSKQKEKNW
jgi:tetratricopeptide (TPR) repeat protein